MVTFLLTVCSEVKWAGEYPFHVPLNLLDPKYAIFQCRNVLPDFNLRTGDLMEHPVCPTNAPNNRMFVDEKSQAWFEGLPIWPVGNIPTSFPSLEAVEAAITGWVSLQFPRC